jgi:hypothetical protein
LRLTPKSMWCCGQLGKSRIKSQFNFFKLGSPKWCSSWIRSLKEKSVLSVGSVSKNTVRPWYSLSWMQYKHPKNPLRDFVYFRKNSVGASQT